MFGKKDVAMVQSTDARTIIGEGVTINADGMFGVGDVKVAGVFFNDIEVDGLLIVQDSGTVKGDVKASSVVIEGYVEGNVMCSNVIHITSTGKVVGDLRCMTLTIDEGASFSGLCEMGDRIKAGGVTYKEEQGWNVDKDIRFSVKRDETEGEEN